MVTAARPRIGADLVIETLRVLGVGAAFGVPGVHALACWEAMRVADFPYVGLRTELAAAFAADGYARASGRPSALMLSTGPGALMSLAGLMEAATSYVPVIAIASQIESGKLGRRQGALHELPDQRASFQPIAKWTASAATVESIPALLAEAWTAAVSPPSGPVFLEVPVDLLTATTTAPGLEFPPADPSHGSLDVTGNLDHVADLLEMSSRPVIWAGGGVIRAGAWDKLTDLAERLDAPVLTTYMGKGAIPETHPLSGGSACDEPPFKETLRTADVVLCVGTELGEEPSSAYTTRLDGTVIQIDASGARIGATYSATPLIGDARAALAALLPRVGQRRAELAGAKRTERLRAAVEGAFRGQDRELERDLLRSIRAALPDEAIHCWDMTILGYWAARDFPARRPRRFLYPVGSGTLGYAWPAAIGAAVAEEGAPVLAVAGDGGIMYALQELASARQAGVSASLLIVDDGGYGILREYQRAAFGAEHGVELQRPDFLAVATGFGVAARATSPATLAEDIRWSAELAEPTVLVLEEVLRPPVTMD